MGTLEEALAKAKRVQDMRLTQAGFAETNAILGLLIAIGERLERIDQEPPRLM